MKLAIKIRHKIHSKVFTNRGLMENVLNYLLKLIIYARVQAQPIRLINHIGIGID